MNLEDLKKLALVVAVVPLDQLGTQPVVVPTTKEVSQNCEVCGSNLKLTKAGNAYTCPNWKDESKGKHTYKRI